MIAHTKDMPFNLDLFEILNFRDLAPDSYELTDIQALWDNLHSQPRVATREEIAEILAQPASCMQMIVARERAGARRIASCGMIFFMRTSSGLTGYVQEIATAPGYEGQGLSTRVNQELIDIARRAGARAIDLTTKNPIAQAMYEKLGYEVRATKAMRKKLA